MSVIFTYRDAQLYCHHSLDHSPEPEKFSVHAHEWMEVLYILSGNGSCLVEGSQYPLRPHDVLIMRAAETHKLTMPSDEDYERIAIHFSADLLESIDPEHRLLRPFLDRPLGQGNRYSADDAGMRLQLAFSDFAFEGLSDIRLNLVARLMLLLTELCRLYDQKKRQIPAVQGLQGQLVAYVNEHLFENISLQSISDAFFRSKSQISRIFHQATGSSLWEYVMIKRLLAARAMIQRGESAGAACAACGFSDYSAFFRAYRAHFHHSPRDDVQKGT